MSTGYSDKPVAMAIKIKHAGFNLTGPVFWCLGCLLIHSAPKDRLLWAGGKKTSLEWKTNGGCQFRMILSIILNWKNKKSHKLQAASLTAGDGYCRMNLERIYYGQ